jgi:hypothetical protein
LRSLHYVRSVGNRRDGEAEGYLNSNREGEVVAGRSYR